MKILIIEPSANGHRFQYLEWVAKAFLKSHHSVIIGTKPENHSHPLLLSLQSEFSDQVSVFFVSGKEQKTFFIREVLNWFWFRKTYKKVVRANSIDRVFVPYMDHIFYAMSLLGSPLEKAQFSGIIMVPTFHHRQIGIIRPRKNKDFFEKALFATCFRSRNLKTVFTIDQTLCECTYTNSKLVYLPDPCSEFIPITQREARQRLGLVDLENIILVFGAITARKGVKDLIKATVKFNLNIHILIVGIHDLSTIQLLNSDDANYLFRKKKLTSVNQYISANLETAYYCASDIVWLGYKDHYAMSGVLVKASACNKSVLACNEGLIGFLTKRYELGEIADIENHGDVASRITNLLKVREPSNRLLRKEFVEMHSLESFINSIKVVA